MRSLVWQRGNADFSNDPVFVLALAPLRVSRVTDGAPGRREFPVVAFVTKSRVRPSLLDDSHRLLEQRSVSSVLLIARLDVVRCRRADARLRGERIHPSRMIAAGESTIHSTLEHVVECRDLLGNSHGIMGCHRVSHNARVQSLAMHSNE